MLQLKAVSHAGDTVVWQIPHGVELPCGDICR